MKNLFPQYNIGHFINKPSDPTGFEILRFEDMEEPDVDDYHKHRFYEILWIEKGKSRQIIDYQEYEIGEGDFFLISPGQMHFFEEWKPVKGGSIMFTEEFFLLNQLNRDKLFELSFLDNFYADPCIRPAAGARKEIYQHIAHLYKEHRRKDRDEEICRLLLHIILRELERVVAGRRKKEVAKRTIVIYKEFRFLLEKHFMENRGAGFYADKLFITQHHLNRVLQTVSGCTASKVIRERTILEARRWLTFTDASVSEIAADLNYFDSSYFAKLFRSVTGMSPQYFRKQMSEKYRTRVSLL